MIWTLHTAVDTIVGMQVFQTFFQILQTLFLGAILGIMVWFIRRG
jgi:hypothetical protein